MCKWKDRFNFSAIFWRLIGLVLHSVNFYDRLLSHFVRCVPSVNKYENSMSSKITEIIFIEFGVNVQLVNLYQTFIIGRSFLLEIGLSPILARNWICDSKTVQFVDKKGSCYRSIIHLNKSCNRCYVILFFSPVNKSGCTNLISCFKFENHGHFGLLILLIFWNLCFPQFFSLKICY